MLSTTSITHEPQPAVPPSVRVLVALEDAVTSTNLFVLLLATFFLQLTFAAMRFEHLQKASFMVILSWAIVFAVKKGKERSGHQRTPLRVGGPRHSLKGVELYAHFCKVFDVHQLQPEGKCFLLPDFGPPTSDITLVDQLLPGRMAQAKAISFIRNILASPRYGLTDADFGNLTAHSWRLLLPSLTDYAQCDPQEKLMVGAWKASGDERAVARNARRVGAMPLRYSAVKPIAQASVKTRLRVGLLLALKKYRERRGTASVAPALEELPPYWPHKGVVADATKQFLEACEAGLQPVALTQKPIADANSSGSSSSRAPPKVRRQRHRTSF